LRAEQSPEMIHSAPCSEDEDNIPDGIERAPSANSLPNMGEATTEDDVGNERSLNRKRSTSLTNVHEYMHEYMQTSKSKSSLLHKKVKPIVRQKGATLEDLLREVSPASFCWFLWGFQIVYSVQYMRDTSRILEFDTIVLSHHSCIVAIGVVQAMHDGAIRLPKSLRDVSADPELNSLRDGIKAKNAANPSSPMTGPQMSLVDRFLFTKIRSLVSAIFFFLNKMFFFFLLFFWTTFLSSHFHNFDCIYLSSKNRKPERQCSAFSSTYTSAISPTFQFLSL
jgi:hypothetical protein